MTTPILVTGGTGTLGRRVVRRLRDAGHEVRVLSRRAHVEDGDGFVVGDLSTGTGAAAAVSGVETVVHCAGTQKGDDEKARQLVRAASRADVTHIVNISVVGAERVPVESAMDRALFGYYASKLGAERVIAESGIPWTTLRATQFHTLIGMVLRPMSRLPVVPVFAGVRFQPVDVNDVAARLVELALDQPAGLVSAIAGPRIYSMKELARSYLAARGKHRPIMSVWLPGKAARALRDGANLAPDRAVGKGTWEDFLAKCVR